MAPIVENPGYCPCCRSTTTFRAEDPWLRDAYVCLSCGSIPRQRHLQLVLDSLYPAWEHLVIHESSPSHDFLSRLARGYTSSQYLPHIPFGSSEEGVRSESIEELTFADESIDLFVTQDVLEHVFHPQRAIADIHRVLRPGGAHIFTVPVHPGLESTVCRARLVDGQIDHLLPEMYHGNPVGDHRALVTFDYGRDFAEQVSRWAGGASVEVVYTVDRARGLDGAHLEVYVIRKPSLNAIERIATADPARPLAGFDPQSIAEGESIVRVSLQMLARHGSRTPAGTATVVDLGQSAGPTLRALAAVLPARRILHLDVADAAATGAVTVPPGVTEVGGALPTPLGNGSVGLVVAGDAFAGLTPARHSAWATEVARLVGSTGVVTLSVSEPTPAQGAATGPMSLARAEIERTWGPLGFRIAEWVPADTISRQAFVVLVAKRPLQDALSHPAVVRASRAARRGGPAVVRASRAARRGGRAARAVISRIRAR